ncbi:MAG: cell division protein ZapA [Balneolaceae bacterium]
MQSLKVNILGKQIPIKVEDSEVENMKKIAAYVDEKFRSFKRELTSQPDSIITILASLSIAEELFELRQKIHEAEQKEGELMDDVNTEIQKLLHDISQ